MREGLLAEKVGMSRFYDKDKINHSVTVLQVKECQVVSLKNYEKDGYNAVTLSHGNYSKSVGKPFKEFLKKNKLKAFSFSREFKLKEPSSFKVGDRLSVSNFMVGQFVDVTSNSIGKGFAGGMKRHNFSGNRATHGVSISHRSHGSTGQCQDPGKVFKGKKMAGRLGNKKVTIQNLKILNIDTENNLIILKGAVPGHKGSVIKIVDAVKKNQKIIVNEDVTKNTNENALPEESKDINTNTNNSENVSENKLNVAENITASTQENVKNKNIENENTQKEIVKADVKEVEKNNKLTSDPEQTEKS